MDCMVRKKFSTPIDREEVARSWAERGFSCNLFIDPPGKEWNNYVHSANEVVTIVDGRLRMTIDNVEFDVEPGDEVFIPRGACHSVKNIHHGTSRWLYGYD